MKKGIKIIIQQAVVFTLALFALLSSVSAQAPEPPIPIELLFGHDNMYFQMVVKKKFAPESKFGFFSVATYTADYQNELRENRLIIPTQFNYSLRKGFGLMAGADINSVVGFAPIVGPQHNYASRKFLAVTVVSFFLNQERDVKLFGLYEYKPPIGGNWSFYSRLQFIYNHSIAENAHNRSYLYLRAGLKRKSLIFGAGANLDQFGPEKIFKDNYGLFFRWEFR